MPRRKSGKAKICPWLSANADCSEGRFIQVGNSLILSEKFQALTAGARVMYLAMSMESGGKKEFVFPLSASKKYGFASMSMRRYIDELEGMGFINKTSGRSSIQPNLYEFSSDWKTN